MPPDEQHLWFPNQVVQDPDTWTLTHLQVKGEYDILVDQCTCIVQETYTVQDPLAPPSDNLLSSLKCLHTAIVCIRSLEDFWKITIEKSNNHRMLEQLVFRAQHSVQATRAQELHPRPCVDNDHPSVLDHEMMVIEPDENPTRTLTWKSMDFLSHIKRRTNDDRFPQPLWETWFCSGLGVPISVLVGPPQPCSCRVFHYMINLVTTCRHARLNRWHSLLTSGSFISSVLSWVLWGTK